jgi:uncharacterized protein
VRLIRLARAASRVMSRMLMRSIESVMPVLAAVLLSGCASPPTTYYTLSAEPSLQADGRPLSVAVTVGPVTIPDLVDRPQIVTRAATDEPNHVKLAEFDRWGESLRSGIADTVAADLGRLLGSDRVAVSSRAAPDVDAWRVRVDVMQFDSVPGDAVTIDARWTLRNLGGTVLSGRSLVREPLPGTGYAALVAAHSRALATVSREIAAAIRRSVPA